LGKPFDSKTGSGSWDREYLDDVDDVELFVEVDARLLRWLPCES